MQNSGTKMRKLIAICPRCEKFVEIKSTHYFKEYFCPCKSFMGVLKIVTKLTVSTISNAPNENKTKCKLVIA